MSTGLFLWDTQVWSFIVTFAMLFLCIGVAYLLRNLIPALRRLMIPSSILGGFLLLAVNSVADKCFGTPIYSAQLLEILTYHGLGLGFVALALRTPKKSGKSNGTDILNTSLVVVCGYMLQAAAGLVITLLCFRAIGSFFASGMLLPMGYGHGPGQAYNWGHIYETSYGFKSGTGFGLTLAAMGFIAASVGGVIHLNLMRRKGTYTKSRKEQGINSSVEENVNTDGGIPDSDSVDKLTIQMTFILVAYLAAYLIMRGINSLLDPDGTGAKGFAGTLQGMLWGFQYLIGTFIAMAIKAGLKLFKKKGAVKRDYINDYFMNRIAGFMFDLMAAASIAAIDLSAFREREFIVPLVIVCVVGALLSYFYLRFVCYRIFPGYRDEAFLSLYGMQTGTASTGAILLSEADPGFNTPASENMVFHMPVAIPFGAPLFLMLGIAPQSSGKAFAVMLICAGLFAAFNVLLFRKSLFGKKKKEK